MKIQIVTPEGEIYKNKNIVSVTVPTEIDVLTILEDHAPIVSLIIPGEIVIKLTEEEAKKSIIKGKEYLPFTDEVHLAVSKGVLEVRRDNHKSVVNILADTAERGEDIDIERAEEARKRAEEFRNQKEYEITQDYAEIQAKIQKELARIEVGRQYKNVGKEK